MVFLLFNLSLGEARWQEGLRAAAFIPLRSPVAAFDRRAGRLGSEPICSRLALILILRSLQHFGRDRRMLDRVTCARTFARFGAAAACLCVCAGALTACGTKTVTKTITVVGTVPNGGATSVSTSVAAGAHDFTQFACAQCHGDRGRGGVSPDVPALTQIGKQLTVAQLTGIINHGLGESANPTKPYMPVWGQVISSQQVSDLVAYIRAGLPAVPGATPPPIITQQGPAVEGALLYQRYGCINCHGPNGLGGVPNPQSPDKAIPPLSGADFFAEFNTDKKITDMIRTGSIVGRAPIVSMPHWGGIIPDQQLQALLAYIKTLKSD
jgi:mono/diheme cytochrome c family protein